VTPVTARTQMSSYFCTTKFFGLEAAHDGHIHELDQPGRHCWACC
jgi:hypothetical protein